MLSEKVKQVKASIPVNTNLYAELVDLSYDPHNTIKNLQQQQKHEFSNKEIAQKYHMSDNAVSRRLKMAGVGGDDVYIIAPEEGESGVLPLDSPFLCEPCANLCA